MTNEIIKSVGPDNCKCEPGYGGPTCNIGMLCSSLLFDYVFFFFVAIWSDPVVAATSSFLFAHLKRKT